VTAFLQRFGFRRISDSYAPLLSRPGMRTKKDFNKQNFTSLVKHLPTSMDPRVCGRENDANKTPNALTYLDSASKYGRVRRLLRSPGSLRASRH